MGPGYDAVYQVLVVADAPYLRAWMNIRKPSPSVATETALSPESCGLL